MEFEADADAPILLSREQRGNGPDEILAAAVLRCENPGCTCTQVFIAPKIFRDEEGPASAELTARAWACGDDSLAVDDLYMASFDFMTETLHVSDESAATNEAARRLREEWTPSLGKQVALWALAHRVADERTIEPIYDAEGPEAWDLWQPGDPAPYLLSYSGPLDDEYEMDDELYIVNEEYCVVPGCTCDVVHIVVERECHDDEPGDELTEIIGDFEVHAGAPQAIRNLHFESGMRETLRRVWQLALETDDYSARLHERIERMKAVSKYLYEVVLPSRLTTRTQRPIVAAEKVGRNEPCPCKSGKKYKKCCGR